jgi:tripartite-type tricarboxylate transporter receptor subunit TctC
MSDARAIRAMWEKDKHDRSASFRNSERGNRDGMDHQRSARDAQSWPTRPVTMVVPFAAGSASDTVGRILAARLSEIFGQQVIVENVGGAGGMTGAARVAKAAPGGYQFVLGGVDTFAQNQTLYKKPLYNSVTASGVSLD